MADNGDSFSIDLGKIATSVVKEITGNVKVDAKDAIKTIKEVMSLCEDLSASKYLGDEKTLINGLTNAYKAFGQAKNKANATDLIGYANALKASSKNYDSVISGLKGFEDRLEQANKKSSEAARVLNEDLFNRLNDLRNGLGMTEKDFLSFTKALESSSGFERLKKELESSKKKIKELKDALDNALNNPRTQELENKLKNIEKQLSQVQGRAKTELAVGLSAMGFSDDQINKDFAKYFDDINRGAATASSALAQIKKELGMVDQEAASSTAVDKLGGDIAELKVNLDSAFDGLEKSFSEIKNEFDKLSDKISKDITKIFNSTKNTTGKSITPKQISNMVDTITNIGEVDTNKLDSVSNALKSVASLSGKQLDGGIAKTTKELCSSFNSFKQQNISGLIDLLKQISSVSGKKIDSSVANGVYRLAGATKIVNPKGVEALSKLDIKKMNNVTVDSSIMNISAMLSSIKCKNIQEIVNGINKLNPSKISGVVIDPSIKNLSYLSSISGKDFSGLKQMNGLNFDWLNNPNINDKKAKALSNIANALEKISKNKNVVKGISTAVASSGSGILNGQNAVSAKSNITFTPPTGASSDVKQALVDLGATKNAADLFAKKITKAGFEIDKVKTTFEKVKDGAKTLTKVVVSASNAIGGTLSTTALINSDTGEIDRTTWNVTNSVKDQMISMQDAYSTIQKMYSVLSRAKDLSGTKAFTDVESALSTFRNLLNGANGDVDQLNLSIISMGQTGASYIKNMSNLVSKLDINISEHIMNNGSKKMSITDIISVRDKMDSVLNSASKFRFDANVNTDATALYDKLKNIIKAIKSIEQGTNIEDAITGAFGKNSTSNGVLGDIEKIIIRIGNRIADIKGNTVFDDSKLTTFLKSASSTAKNKNVDRSSDEHKSLIEDLKTLEKAYSEAGYSAVKMYEDMEKNGTPAHEVIDRITKSAAVLNQQIRSTDVDKIIPDTAKFQTYENSLFALRNKTENAVRNWTAAKYGKSEADYDKLVKSLRAINTLDNNLRGGLLSEEGFLKQRAELTRDVSNSLYTIRQNGENTLGLFNRIQKAAKNFSYWFSTTSIVMGAVNQVRKMVDAVTKLDSAMTELRKVTDETEASYSRFLRDATARAKNMGATVVDTVTATADFARLGYSINEAEDFADAAIIYKNVGDGIESITDASESIIATMQAFDGEIEDVMDIVDKFNNVGNNYAISSKGVGDALLRSAAAMKAANNTIDQTIALATAANEIVQDPDKVGTTLKTISMFLRAAKTEAEEAGESTEGMADSVSKLRDEIKSLTGVDIMLEDGKTFKSTYEILQQISKVWHSLSDVTQANLLEMMGGKRNANIVAAIMNNFSTAERALETSSNSAGSALAENEKVLESIQGRVSIMKATFEELSNTIMNGGFVKGLVSAGTAVIDILNGIAKANLLLPTLIGFLGQAELIQVMRSKRAAQSAANELAMSLLQGESVDKIVKSANELNTESRKRLQISIQQLAVENKITNEMAKQIKTQAALDFKDEELVGMGALSGVSKFSKILMIVSLVTTAIGVLSAAYEHFHKTVEELEAELDDCSDKAKASADQFSSLSRSFKDISERYVELSKGVGTLGNNVSLSTEEYDEFLSLGNQLAEMFPEIDAGIDQNGNHMLSLSNDTDLLKESLKELIEEQRRLTNESIAENIDDSVKALNGLSKESDKVISSLRKQRSEITLFKDAAERKLNGGSGSVSLISDSIMSDANMSLLGINKNDVTVDALSGGAVQYNYNIIDPDKTIAQYKNAIATIDKQIESETKKIKDKWSGSRSVFSAWLQTEDVYITASDEMQSVFSKIMSSIDLSSVSGKNTDEIKSYILDEFIIPISSLTPDVQETLGGLFTMKGEYDSGEGTVSLITDINVSLKDLVNSGVPQEVIGLLRTILGLDRDLSKINIVRSHIADGSVEALEYIKSLTSEEIELAYKFVVASGSMSLEEFKDGLETAKLQASSFIDATDFTGFFSGLDTLTDKIGGIADAMKNLESGTALTNKEMFELVAQYPELLKQSNLFTDGSIAGQKKMLSTVLDVKEKEYAAEIDTMIAKVKAEQALVGMQLEAEKNKAILLGEISALRAKGEVKNQKEITNKIKDYGELEGKNYVTVKQGELEVNEEAYNAMLKQGVSFGEESAVNIWNPYGDMIVDTHEQAAHASAVALARIPTEMKNAQEYIEKGLVKNKAELLKFLTEEYNNTRLSVIFRGVDGKIGSQDLGEWFDKQKEAVDGRIKTLEEIYKQQMAEIENLEALKGLKLSDIYGKDPSGSSSKEKSESQFEKLYKYHKHLVAMEQETEAEFLDWLDDAYKAAYERGEIELEDYYKYQEEVYDGYKKILEEAKDAFDELVEFKKDKIKQDIENQKDALNKQLDDLKKFYDKQKEMLQDEKDEEDYIKEQSEKRKNVTDIMSELEQLKRDNSAKAAKRRKELEQDLVDAQDELDEFEKEHSLEMALDALDKAYEEQESAINKEIEALDKILNDPATIFNQALEAVKNNTGNLYQEMLEYNRQHGSGNDEDIKKQYEEIVKALEEYKRVYGEDYKGKDPDPIVTGNSKVPSPSDDKKKDTTPSSGSSNSGSGSKTDNKNDSKTDDKKSSSDSKKPSLTTGSTITVKKTATNFSAKSKNAKMASYVPGSKYTVYGTSGSEVLIGKNGQYTGWINKTDIEGYASGTASATGGIHQVNELGDELIFSSKNGKNYRIFTPGEKVLNSKASNFLYNFATNGNKILQKIFDDSSKGGSRNKIQPPVQKNEISMGDIYISGNADSKTVSAIRREQRAAVDMVLKEFIKLK